MTTESDYCIGLVEFDENQLPIPGLASWKEISPTHYRFRLADEPDGGREFHDGSRLTAQDVKATYDAVLDPATASPHRATLSMIERIEIIDADTVDFYLNKADILFPAYLVIGILPAKQLGLTHPFHQQPVGSGLHNMVKIGGQRVFKHY